MLESDFPPATRRNALAKGGLQIHLTAPAVDATLH